MLPEGGSKRGQRGGLRSPGARVPCELICSKTSLEEQNPSPPLGRSLQPANDSIICTLFPEGPS